MVNAEALRRVHSLTPSTVTLCVLPLYHANAFGFSFVTTLYAGSRLVLSGQFPQNISHIINDEKIEIVSLVPELIKLSLHMSLRKDTLPSLRYIMSAAAPLTVDLARTFHDRTGIRIQQGWGLSECTNFAATLPTNLSDTNYAIAMHSFPQPSIGSALYGNGIDVIDEHGASLGEEVEGELIVRGGNVMLGYWARPQHTEEALGRGYLRTGDLGVWRYVSGERMYFVTGRVKEVIIRCGDKVSPAAVEAALGTFARTYELMVVGFANSHVGEEIGLYVQGDDCPTLRLAVLAALQPLGELSRPRAVVIGDHSIPRTSTGKPQRSRLKPLFSSRFDKTHKFASPTFFSLDTCSSN